MKLSKSRQAFWSYGLALAILAVVMGIIVAANHRERQGRPDRAAPDRPEMSTSTSSVGLDRTIESARAQLRHHPREEGAAVSLADALLRKARLWGNAGLARTAEDALMRVLKDEPLHYDARRMLA